MIFIALSSSLLLLPFLDSATGRTTNDFCELKPEGGFCRGSFEKFYYDTTAKTCFPFIYGGCQGNKNNFNSFEECMTVCGSKTVIVPVADNRINPNHDKFEVVEPTVQLPASGRQVSSVCTQRPVTGECFGYFPRYFYNMDTDNCEEFIYGGCHGNGNNFETVHECESRCKAVSKNEHHHIDYIGGFMTEGEYQADLMKPVCEQQFASHGGSGGLRCMVVMQKWSYDKSSGTCKKFLAGCRGNKNSFMSQEDCEHTCIHH